MSDNTEPPDIPESVKEKFNALHDELKKNDLTFYLVAVSVPEEEKEDGRIYCKSIRSGKGNIRALGAQIADLMTRDRDMEKELAYQLAHQGKLKLKTDDEKNQQ